MYPPWLPYTYILSLKALVLDVPYYGILHLSPSCTFNILFNPVPAKTTKMASTKAAILSPNAQAPSPLMSQGIIINGMVYCSGSLGIDPKTGKFVDGDVSDRTVEPP